MAERFLVLFAREPRSEAREKGFTGPAGEELFATFAAGWLEAAREGRARLVISAPRADHAEWRRRLAVPHLLVLEQRGRTFGERLENAARQAAALGGHFLLVGGDVAPSRERLREAFSALEDGADSVLAPARDGGVSLIALPGGDLDLLGEIAPRRTDVFTRLRSRLAARGRRVEVVSPAADVDGRRQLRSIVRSLPARLRDAARRALSEIPRPAPEPRSLCLLPERTRPSGLRAPPAA